MRYKSEIFEVIYRDAVEMFAIGAISAARMREYDRDCLVREPEPGKEAAKSTETAHISPAII
jgi:DNA-binding transcriptional regulator YiaG